MSVQARLATVAIAVVMAMTVTPATATTSATWGMVSSMTLTGGGLGYPFVGGGVPGAGVNGGFVPAIVAGAPPPPLFTVTGGNTSGFTWASSICTGNVFNVGKAGKPFNATGACNFSAQGVISGFCGFSQGSATGTFVTPGGQAVALIFSFNDLGGSLKATGRWSKPNGQSGVMWMNSTIVPTTGSCTNNTATGFTITGGTI